MIRNFLSLVPVVLFAIAALPAHAAGDGGVAPYAYELTTLLGLPLTNAIATTWVISLLLILSVRLSIGKPSLVPNRAQAVFENLISGLRDLTLPIIGKKAFNATFPLLICFFVYIMIHNWSGLLPGVGSFGMMSADGHLNYFMRPANSDLNGTLALALVAMAAWLFICLKYAGPGLFFHELFGNKADKATTPAPVYYMLIPIFLGVGAIEVVSILFRPVSLSFRLYGNVFGGENLLTSMTGLVPYIIPSVFYFYEVLVGVVQALIFTLLVAIYIGLVTSHADHDHAH